MTEKKKGKEASFLLTREKRLPAPGEKQPVVYAGEGEKREGEKPLLYPSDEREKKKHPSRGRRAERSGEGEKKKTTRFFPCKKKNTLTSPIMRRGKKTKQGRFGEGKEVEQKPFSPRTDLVDQETATIERRGILSSY